MAKTQRGLSLDSPGGEPCFGDSLVGGGSLKVAAGGDVNVATVVG
jgi:hypothetical protein